MDLKLYQSFIKFSKALLQLDKGILGTQPCERLYHLKDSLQTIANAYIQWLSMFWDKSPMIWDIIDLANFNLDWYVVTKSDYHGNSNVADTKSKVST